MYIWSKKIDIDDGVVVMVYVNQNDFVWIDKKCECVSG